VPALGDEAEQRTKDAGQEPSSIEQEVEIVLRERLASLYRLKRSVDGDEHQNIDDGDGEQKQRRGAGADDTADRSAR